MRGIALSLITTYLLLCATGCRSVLQSSQHTGCKGTGCDGRHEARAGYTICEYDLDALGREWQLTDDWEIKRAENGAQQSTGE